MTEPRSVVCPACGMRSFHPEDVARSWCPNCHAFHDDLLAGRAPPGPLRPASERGAIDPRLRAGPEPPPIGQFVNGSATPRRPPPARPDPLRALRVRALVGTTLALLLVSGLQLARSQGVFGPNWLVFDAGGLVSVVLAAGSVGVQVGLWLAWRWRGP